MTNKAVATAFACGSFLLFGCLSRVIITQKKTIAKLKASSSNDKKRRMIHNVYKKIDNATSDLISQLMAECNDKDISDYLADVMSDALESVFAEKVKSEILNDDLSNTLVKIYVSKLTSDKVLTSVEKSAEEAFCRTLSFWSGDFEPIKQSIIHNVVNSEKLLDLSSKIANTIEEKIEDEYWKDGLLFQLKSDIAEAVVQRLDLNDLTKEIQPMLLQKIDTALENSVMVHRKNGETIIDMRQSEKSIKLKTSLELVSDARTDTSEKWGTWSPENAKQWLKRKIRRYLPQCCELNENYDYPDEETPNSKDISTLSEELDCPVFLLNALCEEMKNAKTEFEKEPVSFEGITKGNCNQQQKEEIISAICKYSIDGNGFMLSEEIPDYMNLSGGLFNYLKSYANECLGLGFRNRNKF